MHTLHRRRAICAEVTTVPLVLLALVGLVMFGIGMETRIIIPGRVSSSSLNLMPLNDYENCSPRVLNTRDIKYHSRSRYYATLEVTSPLPPPVFSGEHTQLCDGGNKSEREYSYCLPIAGRKDTQFCETPDRMDLLKLSAKPFCYASVLHMLLVEVYEELQATGNLPFLAFGTLLGAVRNQSMIPFTEDADIGYVGELISREMLQEALWRKGYHMFHFGIWRVCVAPTHPLASLLYDPSLPLSKNFTVPYVDLYSMRYTEYGDWDMQEFEGTYGRYLLDSRVRPFSEVKINGMVFGTVHDPKYFLVEQYGQDYMTPKRRNESLLSSDE